MPTTTTAADNRHMDHESLFDQAVRLAYETFGQRTTDSHITGVYAVLVWSAQCGLTVARVTVH